MHTRHARKYARVQRSHVFSSRNQALSGVRTVQSLSGQQREKERYAVKLREALQTGLKKARINGTGFGVVMGSFIGTYALGLWFGSWLIINERTNTITGKPFTGGDVIMCFFAVHFLCVYACMCVSV
jgi:ABC-type multidrug transport system fused ATPase/permease subunit